MSLQTNKSIFQTSVLKKYLKHQATTQQEQIEKAWQKFSTHFHNPTIQTKIRSRTEIQYQVGFLTDLFVNVLGYSVDVDNANLIPEFKNVQNAQKVDGAVVNANKDVLAVIELKGTNTVDLGKVEEQVFKYQRSHNKTCKYAITSNFEKLRFYIGNDYKHEEFNLFTLSRQDFELLWFCLNKENIFDDVPFKAKEETVFAEQEITKKLYKDYQTFRSEIFDNIVNNNPDTNKLLLFKKTQKLLDRFLFVFFAEDRGLLQSNSIKKILDDWNEGKNSLMGNQPLYNYFKQFFGFLNTGLKTKDYDIYAYNGGLFQPDEVLDSLLIDDELLEKHTLLFSQYDFESEVSVNILGHIFEHSLNDLEEMQAQIEGKAIDSKNTKRKKDGVFYTPQYITQYIVENTVGKLCEEKKEAIHFDESEYALNIKGKPKTKTVRKKLLGELDVYRSWLKDLTICDPACGSGAFLNEALQFLINEHRYLDELEAKLQNVPMVLNTVENAILEKNLYGVDINQESVEIAKLSLWLSTAKKNRKLSSLNNNIKCGNSLIDDESVAGEKAFKWEQEFPEVFKNGGFDVVVGNPPYVFARENMEQSEKDYYNLNFKSAEYQVNTYLLFIERSIDIIKDNSFYGLIVPNAWLMVYSAKGLRELILKKSIVDKVVNLAGYSFEGVNVETIIISAKKGQNQSNSISVFKSLKKEFIHSHNRNQSDFLENEGFEFKVFSDDESKKLSNKLNEKSIVLDEITNIKAGLKAYQTGKGKPKQTKEDVQNRPFDYNYKYDENTFPYLEGKNVSRYGINWSGSYLRFGKHLAEPRMFKGEKIIIREITGKFPNSIIGTYTNENYLFNLSNIAVLPKDGSNLLMKYLLVVLNSKLIAYYFLKNTAKSVRKMFPKIILKDLRKFPFKKISIDEQKPFIEKADQMLSLNTNLNKNKNRFLKRLQSNFELDKLSKKIQAFYDYDFKTLLSELKKKKIKLSLVQQDEWEEYFEEYTKEIKGIQSQINKTDSEIDQMVYELYGLTEDEIKIVEEAV